MQSKLKRDGELLNCFQYFNRQLIYLDNFRVFNTNLITISTSDKIYMFDVLALNFKTSCAKLKEVLEGDEHLKVVYNCRGLMDNLKTRLNIELKPVSDLLLVAALYYEKNEVVGLNNCIKSVLGVNNVISDKGISLKRPIAPDDLRDIATKTAYHLAMHHKLVQKDFTSRMTEASKDFLHHSFNSDGLFESLSSSKADEEIEKILKIQSQSTPKKFDLNVYTSE